MRDELIKDVYFGAYQHIGFSFMEKIIDERIISVNMGALHQMSLGMVPKICKVQRISKDINRLNFENF